MTHDTLDNSLDLKKLAARLWTTKHWMISAAVLGILCALLYSKFSEQRWHSVARLEPPSLSQVFDYYQALQQLQILTATQTALPLDADKLTSQVYQLFILNLQSEDTQKAFWSQSNLPRRFQLANPANNQWSTALNRIGYIPADLNKSTHDSVQLQADTPEITLQLLQQYLQFVAAKTLNELNRDLQSKWQLALNGLHTQIQLQQTILRLKQPNAKLSDTRPEYRCMR